MFPCKPDILINALRNLPLQVIVSFKQKPLPIGQTSVQWTPDFVEMVEGCKDSAGYISPAYYKRQVRVDDSSGQKCADLDLFVRLSCFGKDIQTNIQILVPKDAKDGAPVNKQFLFKCAALATTFQCEK